MANRDSRISPTIPLVAGGIAGLAVDISLFPLDTIKTRIQSAPGFWKSGGFRGVYAGLPSAAVGSVPNAAVFFLTYESIKQLGQILPASTVSQPFIHMFAASCGEVTACVIRVPVEVVKQRTQAKQYRSSWDAFRFTVKQEGVRGLYRGYLSTVVREIPFSLIQFPLWEALKASWSTYQGGSIDSWQVALCGAVAGAISAGVTTPLDVAKTRIMLAQKDSTLAKGKLIEVLQIVHAEKGFKGLFSGFIPRVTWISIGGAIFLGVYDKSRNILANHIA